MLKQEKNEKEKKREEREEEKIFKDGNYEGGGRHTKKNG